MRRKKVKAKVTPLQRIKELLDQERDHDLWGATEKVEEFIRIHSDEDWYELDRLHAELERLSELMTLVRTNFYAPPVSTV